MSMLEVVEMSDGRRQAFGRQVREAGVTLPGLHAARLKALVKQVELAEKAGVSRATVTNAERGQRVAYVSAEKLAKALDTSVEALQQTPKSAGG